MIVCNYFVGNTEAIAFLVSTVAKIKTDRSTRKEKTYVKHKL